ncbi:alpha/beta hydrolase [Microcoleus sp. FACHB-1515]|nr:alpha/beta hydrolase [Microcoleus sp. FACHB-1515]
MGDSSNWRFLVPLLQSRHRCISLDLLGFGDSSKPQIRYDIAQQVEFLDQVIAALGLENCAIAGHSLGGWVASAYALAHPDRVRALVLVAPAGIRDDSFCGKYDHLRPLLWQTPIVDWALSLADPIAPLLGQEKNLNQLRWFRRELNAQPAARSFLVDRLRPEDAIDTVEKEIHRLRVPTLVIAGELDETIPMWHCQTYAREILHAQLEIIPHADHALPQKNSESIATLVEPFLAQLEAAIDQ